MSIYCVIVYISIYFRSLNLLGCLTPLRCGVRIARHPQNRLRSLDGTIDNIENI